MWVCRLPVHIGPLGSCEFAEDYHKKRCILPGRCGHRPLQRLGEFVLPYRFRTQGVFTAAIQTYLHTNLVVP